MRLRALEYSDLAVVHQFMNREIDLVLDGYGDWGPRSLAAMEHSFKKGLDDPPAWHFVVEVDGTVIGDLGLHYWNADHRSGSGEFYIMIGDPRYIGKGYGREALGLLLGWGFVVQNFRRIGLTVFATNERARRMYRAVGFVEEGTLRQHAWHNGDYVDLMVMGLLRSEWASQAKVVQHNA
ncbi:MAG: GNAT family N-acetyltransferase [Herpetosiphon sp.]